MSAVQIMYETEQGIVLELCSLQPLGSEDNVVVDAADRDKNNSIVHPNKHQL